MRSHMGVAFGYILGVTITGALILLLLRWAMG